MHCSMPGFLVHHQLPEVAQTLLHRVGDAIQPSHPLLTSSPPAFHLSQHQEIFQWVSSSHQVAKILAFKFQHQSFQWIFRTDFLEDWLVWSPCSPRDSQGSSPTIQFKSISSLALSSVQSLSCVWLLQPHGLQHARLLCPSPAPRACSNSCPLSRGCNPNISSSVIPFSFCLQSLPASGSLPRSQFFASGSQSIGVSASASVLPINIRDWTPLRWTAWISLQSKVLLKSLLQHHSSKA